MAKMYENVPARKLFVQHIQTPFAWNAVINYYERTNTCHHKSAAIKATLCCVLRQIVTLSFSSSVLVLLKRVRCWPSETNNANV